MTVTYTHEVANARLGGFSNLLLRWRGSVYKLFYKEFIIYIVLYIILSMSYRWIDHPDFRNYFEKLCLQFQSYTDLIPISFVLGFYVSIVVGRWWQQYESIPWPDRLMVIIAANVHGPDYRGRLIRRTLVRYLSLAQVLTYRSISTAVFKRFPTIQHVIDAGFMTQTEYKQYDNVKTENVKYFVPCIWFSNLLSKVRQEGRIYDDMTYQAILKELNDFRGCCGMLFSYDWISIPLVYTQVVTVAVYVFFMSTLLSRQYLDVTKGYPGHEVDLYVPIFTICQFFFYVGWLKVAEQLINPFGEDDDDFEVNAIIDRNMEISMLTVDNMYLTHPKLEKDIYWNNPNPSIPYTAAAANHNIDAFLGSTYDMSLHKSEMQFVGQAESPPNNDQNYLDVNHNLVDVEKTYSIQETSTFVPGKSPQNKNTTNAINFWKRLTGRDQENEAKKSLLGSEHSSSRVNTNGKDKSSADKREKEEGERETLFSQQDSDDDSDSDVGDSSSDDGSDVNHNQRRSSLSSEDENENKIENDTPTDSHRSLTVRKHSIDEPEDRPRAKKLKKSTLLSPQSPKNGLQNNNTKPRRPDLLITNCSDNSLMRKPANRSMFGKGKKSPKKKTNTTKFVKRNDFERAQGGETEEERRNAQIRTIGLLKATKKKSVQALQRNARRANYPGNAWLRYKYPLQWRPDIANLGDYTSMTSGAEDHGKTENDSPFGSILSFGTSIPSPRPLRFSQFGKGRRKRYLDSMSASSCLTSPCANEDYSPCFVGYSGSPRTREEYFLQTPCTPPASSVSMPFTEDLRRRLLVVNTNTPSSSTAPSPTMSRAFAGSHQFAHTQGGPTGSDDLLIIAPSETPSTTNTAWVGTLEAIGEVPRNEPTEDGTKESAISNKEEQKITPKDEDRTDSTTSKSTKRPLSKNNFTHDNLPPLPTKAELEKNTYPRNILRSKSCPDVPIAKRCNLPPSETSKNSKNESDSESSDDETGNSELKETKSLLTSGNAGSNADSPTRAAVHWESECNKKNTASESEKIPMKNVRGPTSPRSSHSYATAPAPQEKTASDTSVKKNEFESKVIEAINDELVTFSSTPSNFTPQASQSDLGYYSAKEDVAEALAHSKSMDMLSKIRNLPKAAPNRYSFHAISESIKKQEETKALSNTSTKISHSSNDCSISESVTVTTTSNPSDVIISIV